MSLSGLYQIWLRKNQDLNYYFENLFEPSLDLLRKRVETTHGVCLFKDGKPKYEGLFVPVGYALETVALIPCLFQTDHITLAYSESAGRFYRRMEPIIRRNIAKFCPTVKLESMSITAIDNKTVETGVLRWIDTMTKGYGLSLAQIALDITGGTKPMAVGIQNIAQALNIDAYYLKVDYDEDTQSPIPGTEHLLQMSRGLVNDKFVFVVMPFADEFRNIYELGIKKAIEAGGNTCGRVDEEIFLGGIMDKIRENIAKARFIVADISVYNPNVYYELGLAEGMQKDIIMLTSNVDTLPFDLKHKRVIPYNPNNINQLKIDLENNLRELQK
ncbi:MAG TPA: hypothetical protein ACFYEL_01785 [Candidatus Wunengus californicus]|uniref:hypothetical protein n=1 Tax=Candidatus Wunengus californicus TaxID=3367619 RepID=UPI00402970E5